MRYFYVVSRLLGPFLFFLEVGFEFLFLPIMMVMHRIIYTFIFRVPILRHCFRSSCTKAIYVKILTCYSVCLRKIFIFFFPFRETLKINMPWSSKHRKLEGIWLLGPLN